MVSQTFVNSLNVQIQKQLKNVLSGTPYIRPYGSSEDQYKGLGDDLKTKFIPFRKSEYRAEEYLFARVPVNDRNLTFFDFVTPIVNVREKSVQGIASFVTSVPYSVPETFVERMVGLKHKMVPRSLVVEQNVKPKAVIKQQMIASQAVNAINMDKKLCGKLKGNWDCQVAEGGLSKKYYKVKLDYFNYPPGMFSIVPYKGHSILIAKEAGSSGSKVNFPKYPFGDRFAALSGVANYIASHPEVGEDVGELHMDSSLEIALLPLLKHLDSQKAQG